MCPHCWYSSIKSTYLARVEQPDYLRLGGKLLYYFLLRRETDVSLTGQCQQVWINVLSRLQDTHKPTRTNCTNTVVPNNELHLHIVLSVKVSISWLMLHSGQVWWRWGSKDFRRKKKKKNYLTLKTPKFKYLMQMYIATTYITILPLVIP